jgi:hypothetical protein
VTARVRFVGSLFMLHRELLVTELVAKATSDARA